jgi:hypothetical protein
MKEAKLVSSASSLCSNGASEPSDDLESNLSLLKRKSTLTSESKDLLQRLNLLKKEMQKNISSEPNGSLSQTGVEKCRSAEKEASRVSLKHQGSFEKIDRIRENVVGFNTRYVSPFNIELEAVYVDHTATNRPYRAVEDMIKYAKKFAANPHTEFSHFGSKSPAMQSTPPK